MFLFMLYFSSFIQPSQTMKKNDLSKFTNHRVKVYGKDSRFYEGDLLSSDEGMNIVVDDTEEFRITGVDGNYDRRYLGLCMFRGDYVLSVDVLARPAPNHKENQK
jgi:small nuclear ribonucleoprotein (snRNP)-like protein